MEENVVVFIVIGIGIFLFIYYFTNTNNSTKLNEDIREYEYFEQGLIYIDEYKYVSYFGGFKDKGKSDDIKVIVFENKIDFKFSYDDTREIFIKDIHDCRIQTEKQLSERVSMGKLLCFGVLAFGMKGKQKELSKDYVVVRYNYENEDIDLVLDLHYGNEEFVREINNLMEECKCNKDKNSMSFENVELGDKSNDEDLADSILYMYKNK